MKPDQERVNNLLRDTVTLLCKNGLTYTDELRVEALIGITVDSNDVFLVHINERFGPEGESKSDRGTPATESNTAGPGGSSSSSNNNKDTGNASSQSPAPVPQGHGAGSSDSGSVSSPGWGDPPRLPQSGAPQVDLSRVKLESVDAAEGVDGMEECLVVRSPQAVAQQARMVAGQRRGYNRHTSSSCILPQPTSSGDDTHAMRQQYSHSHSMASSDGSFTDFDQETGEPPLKMKKQAAEDQTEQGHDESTAYFHNSGQDSGHLSQWPNVADLAAQQVHAFQDSPDSQLVADGSTTIPGCSSWPLPTGSQRPLIPGTPGSDMMLGVGNRLIHTMAGFTALTTGGFRAAGGRSPVARRVGGADGRDSENLCPFCGKSFTSRGDMKRHIRTHTGERPFKCRYCGRGSTQSYNNKLHEKTCKAQFLSTQPERSPASPNGDIVNLQSTPVHVLPVMPSVHCETETEASTEGVYKED